MKKKKLQAWVTFSFGTPIDCASTRREAVRLHTSRDGFAWDSSCDRVIHMVEAPEKRKVRPAEGRRPCLS